MKNHLDNPQHYNRMVRLMVEYNPLYKRCSGEAHSTAEEEAANIIDFCIRGALVDDDCATGCCIALRTSTGKVRLFLEPLIP